MDLDDVCPLEKLELESDGEHVATVWNILELDNGPPVGCDPQGLIVHGAATAGVQVRPPARDSAIRGADGWHLLARAAAVVLPGVLT